MLRVTDRSLPQWYCYDEVVDSSRMLEVATASPAVRGPGMSMSMMRQCTRLAVALLILVVVAGCTGSGGQVQEDSTAQASTSAGADPEAQASETPGQAPGEEAPTAPGEAPGEEAPESSGAAPGTPGEPPEGEAPGSAGGHGAPGLPGGPDEEATAPESPITIPPFQQIGGQPVDDVRQQIEAAIREACTPRHDLCVTTVVEPRNGADAHACFGGTNPSTHPDSAQLNRGAVLTIYSEPGGCGAPNPTSDPPPSSDPEPSEDSQPPPSNDAEPSAGSQPPSDS